MKTLLKLEVVPDRDDHGCVTSFNPLDQFPGLTSEELGKIGKGPYCAFRANEAPEEPGAFVVIVDGKPIHVGCTINSLRKELNDYGRLSKAACSQGGQVTHCRINNQIFLASKAGLSIEIAVWPSLSGEANTLKKNLKKVLALSGNG